jgi:type IV pilus assembly protein PilW
MKAWRDRGFSLVDLLVATAAMGLVMASLLAILRSGTATYRWGAARVEAQQSARAALERMAAELRGAGYDPTSAGIAPIVTA